MNTLNNDKHAQHCGMKYEILYSRTENEKIGKVEREINLSVADDKTVGKEMHGFETKTNQAINVMQVQTTKQKKCKNATRSILRFDRQPILLRPLFEKPADLNFLAVHSNEHIKREREKLWRSYQSVCNPIGLNYTLRTRNLNYTRPRLPYLPWDYSHLAALPDKKVVLSMFDKTFNVFEENDVSSSITDLIIKHGSSLQLCWTKSSSMLTAFVHDLRVETDENTSAETEKIQSDVEIMLLKVLKEWEQKYRMFKKFKLLKAGSTYEGTKVGKPDEFDFMIELPSLSGVLEFKDILINTESELKNVAIIDRSFFADLYMPEDENENDKTFVQHLWLCILGKMSDDLKRNLLPNWKWLNTMSLLWWIGTLSLTQQLMWFGEQFPSLHVDIDVCLAIPQQNGNFDTGIDLNQALLDQRRPGITDFYEGVDHEDEYIHVILRSAGQARVTMAAREMKIWKMVKSQNRRALYRCLKQTVNKFFPKTWTSEYYRLDSLIPSYWIKTLMFYMFTYYAGDKHWDAENLPLRLVEVFFLLEECLHSKTLSSFFVPHNVLKLRSGKEEIYPRIEKAVRDLNENLCKLQLEDVDVFASLREMENNASRMNEKTYEKGLYESLMELLYYYGDNEYSSKSLESIKSFVSDSSVIAFR